MGPLGYSPDTVTEVILTDNTDSANGSATALPYNAISLFITAPGDHSPLGDYDDWYLGLMTHEYTHILHTDNISGIPALMNAVLGKVYAPNQIQPRWIVEGLAVVAESRYSSGGRIRSSTFDMFLRADFLDHNVAGLDEISSNARRWPQGTLWYLYGSRFLQWIADVYGPDTLRAVSADYGAALAPWGINRAIRRATGRTYEELYVGFKNHLHRQYGAQMGEVRRRGLREGRRITFHGRDVHYPRFLPTALRDGASPYQLVYFRNDATHRSGQYRLVLDGESTREQLLARASAESPASWTPTGKLVFASVHPWRRVYRRTDLYSIPPGERAPEGSEHYRKALTNGMRARAPHVSGDGRRIVFTLNTRGTSYLQIADIGDDGQLVDRRTLVPSRQYDQKFTPVFSPDGKKVAYSSWNAGGFRDIYVVDVATLKVERITNDRAIDANPVWSPDGNAIFFTSDRTGISNVYVHRFADGLLRQVTNVRTGALMPSVSEDGRLLAYVGYTSSGYDLYVMALDEARFLDAPPPSTDRPAPYSEPPDVPMRRQRYNPLPTLRPHTYSFEYAPGNFGTDALTLSTEGGDITGHHAFGLTMNMDVNAPGPAMTLDYAYLRLPADLSLRIANRFTPRNDFRFSGQTPTYVERSFIVRPQIAYTDAREFGNQRISVSYNAAILDGDLPVANTQPLDPYASVTRLPPHGYLGTLRFGYSFSTVESAFDTAPGPSRGVSLSLSLDIADKATLSDETLLSASYRASGYIPMPWPGFHTVAIHSAGGMSKGSYARRGLFFVGGYNLDDATVFEEVIDGIFDGSYALRGYPPGTYSGSSFLLNNIEYRIPIASPDLGPSTLPLFLRRVDGAVFVDHGGAFNEFDFEQVKWFEDSAVVDSPQLHTSVGAELWFGVTFGYGLASQLRLGYVYGLDELAIQGGHGYFIASSAF